MSKILYVSSSVRPKTSHSHLLGQGFCQAILDHNPKALIIKRDVGSNPPPHPDEAYTIANYTPPLERTESMNKALEVSDSLIDELVIADRLIFAVPMYNFSIPSTFKAYIDNLVRIGKTFTINGLGEFEGILSNKKVVIITSRGAVYSNDSPLKSFDHQEPYLRTVFNFMGLTDLEFVHAEGLDFGDEPYKKQSLDNAKKRLCALAESW